MVLSPVDTMLVLSKMDSCGGGDYRKSYWDDAGEGEMEWERRQLKGRHDEQKSQFQAHWLKSKVMPPFKMRRRSWNGRGTSAKLDKIDELAPVSYGKPPLKLQRGGMARSTSTGAKLDKIDELSPLSSPRCVGSPRHSVDEEELTSECREIVEVQKALMRNNYTNLYRLVWEIIEKDPAAKLVRSAEEEFNHLARSLACRHCDVTDLSASWLL